VAPHIGTEIPQLHTHRLSRSSCVSLSVPRDRRLCSKEVTAREKRKQASGAVPSLPLPHPSVWPPQQTAWSLGLDNVDYLHDLDTKLSSPSPAETCPPGPSPQLSEDRPRPMYSRATSLRPHPGLGKASPLPWACGTWLSSPAPTSRTCSANPANMKNLEHTPPSQDLVQSQQV
jgi:hypothetical protein